MAGHDKPTGPEHRSAETPLAATVRPWLRSVLIAWALLVPLEIALNLLVSGDGLRNSGVSALQRVTVTGWELLSLLLAVATIGGILSLLSHAAARVPSTTARRAIGALQGLVVWMAVLLYGASWALYWNTGFFLDSTALSFWASQPVQMFHWVYPPLAIAVLVAVSVLAVGGSWATSRVTAAASRSGVPALTIAVTGAVICGVLATTGAALYDWETLGQPRTPYGTAPTHAGPVAFALQSSEAGIPAAQPGRTAGSTVRVQRRPIITMDQYLAGVSTGRMRRLNVVMIQVESLRADQLREYGGTRDVMPTLDRLARESRVFTRAYIQASHSNYADTVPLASQYPLRSAEMSGSYPERPDYPRVLIYDPLKALGYRTAVFSSQNERWGGMINYHRLSSLDKFFHAAVFNGPTYAPWEDSGFAEWVKQTEGAGSVDDRYTVDEAITWLDTVGQNPFFLHMNLQSSHLPYVVPAGFRRPFGPDTLDFAILWGRFPIEKTQVVKDRYADSLFYIDQQISRLFERLQKNGQWANTIVVIGGDNGEAFYEHGFAAHASWLFDEVVRVPMLVRVPGLAPGRDDRPAMFLDVPPTVFDLLALPPHPGFQGISLFADNPDPNRPLYMIAQTPAAYETAIVRGGFKLHYAEKENRFALNDLGRDPGETRDVAATYPTIVEDLKQRMLRWRQEQLGYYADPVRQSKEYPPVIEE